MITQMHVKSLSFALILNLLPFLVEAQESIPLPMRATFAYCSISPEHMALWVAKDGGLFKKYGIDAQLVFVVSDVRVVQAMTAGDIHLATCTFPSVIRGAARGTDVVVVAGLVNHLTFKLWTTTGSPISRAQDLKGKRIGISNLGSTTHLVGSLILQEHGIRTQDVIFRALGASPARLAGLEQGLVDAAVFGGFSAGLTNRLKLVFDAANLKVRYPGTALLSTRKFIKTTPEVVENAIKAVAEAVAFITDPANKGSVMAVLRHRLRLKSPEEVRVFYEETQRIFDRNLTVPTRGIEAFIRFLTQDDAEISKLKAEDLVDLRFLSKLEQNGFMQKLRPLQ